MPRSHRVKDGDCIASIAAAHGFEVKTLRGLAENASLRELRRDLSVLHPGDVVAIPDVALRQEPAGTGRRHRYQRRGGTQLRLRLTLDDAPRSSELYRLEVGGQVHEGSTDGDGRIEVPVPPEAVEARLVIGPEGEEEVFDLRIGYLHPIGTDEGVVDRLRGVGIDVDDGLGDAVREFQAKEGLEETGQVDEATRARLQEVFGQ
jgi:N-acetylmuramoyl-L-alanine amidase